MVRLGHSQPVEPGVARSGYEHHVRPELVRRLRQQLAAGAYDPPVEELVDRLVSAVIARHAPNSAGQAD